MYIRFKNISFILLFNMLMGFWYQSVIPKTNISTKDRPNNIILHDFIANLFLYKRDFGNWSIDESLFNFVRAIVPEGRTIVELGSGWASGEFSKYYTVYSIEHCQNWLDKYDTHYIYAPIKNGWYDREIVSKNLPAAYDLILVDGPPQKIGRWGFLDNLDLFKSNVPIFFDDVNRQVEFELLQAVAKKLERCYHIFASKNSGKKIGVIFPE